LNNCDEKLVEADGCMRNVENGREMKSRAVVAGDLLNSDAANQVGWQAEQLRCTGFLVPLFDVSAEAVFRSFADCDPVHISENRQQAIQTANGTLDQFKLDVTKLPGRVDVILRPTDDAFTSSGISLLGTWTEAVDFFTVRVTRWLQSQPQLQRLAFGTTVLAEVKDRMNGYSLLNKLLPKVDIDVEHTSDFLYQVNRPRLAMFDSHSIKINRLSKWSVQAVVLHTFTISAKDTLQAASNVVAAPLNYCRAELDVNTDAEISNLPQEHLSGIWNKLVEYAREILLRGDIL
jgi:hypothetical protein